MSERDGTGKRCVRDGKGDGGDGLSRAAATGAGSGTLKLLTRGADGRLGLSDSLTRSGVVSGWVLR